MAARKERMPFVQFNLWHYLSIVEQLEEDTSQHLVYWLIISHVTQMTSERGFPLDIQKPHRTASEFWKIFFKEAVIRRHWVCTLMNSSNKLLCSERSLLPSFFFCFALFSRATSITAYNTVSRCAKRAQAGVSPSPHNAKRHWLEKTFENAEMKRLDYIFFLIPVLKCTLLYFSSSHTQTNTAPCNNKQYRTASL